MGLVFACSALAACASVPTSGSSALLPDNAIRLVVENDSWMDMDIYLLNESGARWRVGDVVATRERSFRISPTMLGGGGSFRLVADPVGSQQLSVSDVLVVPQGTVAHFKIGNAAANTFAYVR